MVHPYEELRKRQARKKPVPRHPALDKNSIPADFQVAVSLVQKRDKCSRLVAMRTARQEFRHLFLRHQSEGVAAEQYHAAKIRKQLAVEKHPDVLAFHAIVDRYQSEHACPRLIALTRVARDRPDLLRKYRDAQVQS